MIVERGEVTGPRSVYALIPATTAERRHRSSTVPRLVGELDDCDSPNCHDPLGDQDEWDKCNETISKSISLRDNPYLYSSNPLV